MEQTEDFNVYMGTQIPLTDRGNCLDIAVFTSPFFAEVWKDPYKTGSNREETDVTRYGINIALNDVLGTSLSMSFKATIVDVDEDEIGRIYSNLRRDSHVYMMTGEHRFSPTSNLSTVPSLSLMRGDSECESNSFYRYGMALKCIYTNGDMTFMPMIRYAFTTYDKTHPIFDTTREDNHYLAVFIATYSDPFGFQDYFIRIIGGYGTTDSTITFCDGTGKFIGLTVGYSF
jgi:hypothetical protein